MPIQQSHSEEPVIAQQTGGAAPGAAPGPGGPFAGQSETVGGGQFSGFDAGVQRAPGFGGYGGGMFNALSRFSQGSLGADAEKFNEDLKKHLNAASLPIEVLRLMAPTGTQAFITNGVAYLILFPDVFGPRPGSTRPESDIIQDAQKALLTLRPKTRLANAVLVHKHDYANADKFAADIHDTLLVATDPEVANLDISVTADTELVMDVTTENARAFIMSRWPHAVAPRIDVAVIAGWRPQRRNTGLFFSQQQNQFDDVQPLVAVGGYSEVAQTFDAMTGRPKFIPVFRITAIRSAAPLPALTMLAIAMAADVIVRQGHWKQQFRRFTPGSPNLGVLGPDPQDPSKPWFAKNPNELEMFIHQNLSPAALALDVVEGQVRNPSVAWFADPNGSERIIGEIARFFNLDRNQLNTQAQQITPVATLQAVEYLGFYTQSGSTEPRDSRELSYIDLVSRVGAVDEQARQALLDYRNDPTVRFQTIQRLQGGALTPVYRDQLMIINGNLANLIATLFRSKVNFAQASGISGVMPLDAALQSATQLAQGMSPLATGGGFSGFGSNTYVQYV